MMLNRSIPGVSLPRASELCLGGFLMYLNHFGWQVFSFGLIGVGRDGDWEGICT
ncbi:hypothetical protein ACW5XX_14395 [Aeromonas mytilicola]